MGNHNDRHLEGFLKKHNEFVQLRSNNGVQTRGRLIKHQNLGTKRESTRDGGAFLHATDSSCGCNLPKSARPTTANFIQTISSMMVGASLVCSRRVRATLSSTESELNRA